MGSRHLKSHPAPRFWPIPRKEWRWAVKPRPGPHSQERCIPLAVILRDVLHYAETLKEARKVLNEGKVLVDGVVRRDYKFPVGLMDVISIPAAGKHFRVVPHPQRFLALQEIDEEEAQFKLCRIENKTTVKGGHIQLNLHDGRNYLVRVKDPFNPVEDTFSTLDTIKISLPDGELLDHYPFGEGVYAVIIDGQNVGAVGKVSSITPAPKKRRNLVEIRSDGEKYTTIADYIFVVGKERIEVTLIR